MGVNQNLKVCANLQKKNDACHKDTETERGGKMKIHNRKLLKKLTSCL
jgi:hypothetical protein